MAQSHDLIHALKQRFKACGLSYAAIAQQLNLSEATIKRSLAKGESISLERLEALCKIADWDFNDLNQAAQKKRLTLECLSPRQEREIASDLVLLIVAVSVINGFTMHDLQRYYELSEAECIQKLLILERLDLIELKPGNRIKLKISANFRWNPNGPIQTFFLDKVVGEFFASRFSEEHEKLLVLNGLLSYEGNSELQAKLEALSLEFGVLTQNDQSHDMSQKYGNTLVLALRRWRLPLFEQHRKTQPPRVGQ
ncbi:MAG: transcriptional regulator with XRE-family HTH domain [Flavobacteriales bacterium]|jgi:transcriptional regulator with XRE-family HTH domain